MEAIILYTKEQPLGMMEIEDGRTVDGKLGNLD